MINIKYQQDYVNNSWKSYYERISSYSISNKEETPESIRITNTISLIPKDCSSILELGCGNGAILNHLISRYKYICGFDLSRIALNYVKTEKIVGNLTYLPFRSKSFDLVLCCEVLEHLLAEEYSDSLKEMERVASKYIIITVPHELIQKNLCECPYCHCKFHPDRHNRSFNSEVLTKLFPNFDLKIFKPCIIFTKHTPEIIIRISKSMGLIPTRSFPKGAICPQCGYSDSIRNIEIRINDNKCDCIRSLLNYILPQKKQIKWLMAVYERK